MFKFNFSKFQCNHNFKKYEHNSASSKNKNSYRERTDWARSPSWRKNPTSPLIATASRRASESSLSAARCSSGSAKPCAFRMWYLEIGIVRIQAIDKRWFFYNAPITVKLLCSSMLRFWLVSPWKWRREKEERRANDYERD